MDRSTETRYPEGGDGDGKSAGRLMKEVTEDLSTLVRKEVELAKQELGQSVTAKVKGAVVLGVVAALGLFALIFLLLTVRDALDLAMPTWAASLVTALILLVVAGGAGLFARKKLATPISAEMTKQTLKDDVEFAKSIGRRTD